MESVIVSSNAQIRSGSPFRKCVYRRHLFEYPMAAAAAAALFVRRGMTWLGMYDVRTSRYMKRNAYIRRTQMSFVSPGSSSSTPAGTASIHLEINQVLASETDGSSSLVVLYSSACVCVCVCTLHTYMCNISDALSPRFYEYKR